MENTRECQPPSQHWFDRAPQLGGHLRPTINGREPELSGLRSLIKSPLIVQVDDESSILILMHLIFERYGYSRLKTFTSAIEALAFCQETRPDLLITDIMRPDIDGLTLCRIIRDDANLHDLPLIVLSACPSYACQAQQIGATFISKPCLPGELIQQVDHVILASGLTPPPR